MQCVWKCDARAPTLLPVERMPCRPHPQDAVWATGKLQCSTPGHVYLLLKSSDLVQYDVSRWREAGVAGVEGAPTAAGARDVDTVLIDAPSEVPAALRPHLVLRRWSNLYLSNEYRCFVRDGALVGALGEVAPT